MQVLHEKLDRRGTSSICNMEAWNNSAQWQLPHLEQLRKINTRKTQVNFFNPLSAKKRCVTQLYSREVNLICLPLWNMPSVKHDPPKELATLYPQKEINNFKPKNLTCILNHDLYWLLRKNLNLNLRLSILPQHQNKSWRKLSAIVLVLRLRRKILNLDSSFYGADRGSKLSNQISD